MNQISFLDRIADSASRYADRPAFSCGDVTVTYSELAGLANGIRDLIHEMHPVAPERIGIVTGDDVQTYAAILAVWSLGAAYVPLNARSPAERNARVIAKAELDIVLTSRERDEWKGHLPDLRNGVNVIPIVKVKHCDEALQFPTVKPEDVAYIFFTSGSTGMPKGVPISHASLSAFMDVTLTRSGYEYGPQDRFLQMFEMTFDLSVVSILTPWSVGACCCAVSEKGIAYLNILSVLQKSQVTVALMVPSVLPYLQRFFDEIRLPGLRLSQFCGEALMQDMASQWSECVPNAVMENVYGPTEATIYCTRYSWHRDRANDESVNGIVPIGRPLPGVTSLVLDQNGVECGPGTQGELCLAGDQVMSGYWKDGETTEKSFVSVSVNGSTLRAYRTGDLAYRNNEGNLIFCGRLDSQVKIDGHRIELGEIEYFARRYIGHSSAAVVVTADPSGSARLKLFVAGDGIDLGGLEQCLNDNLPPYMRPSSVTRLPQLPLNLNGKIDRPALKSLAIEQAS